MKVYISKERGFCQGVAKAVRLALENVGERTFTYGALVHNKRVLASLEEKGIKPLSDLKELREGDTLIIRAHGAPKSVFDFCEEKKVKIIDATCSFVRVIQERAEKYYKEGYKILLIGDGGHPEIIGINGWCGNDALIVSGEEKVDLSPYEKVLVMFQTTYNYQNVQSALNNLLSDSVKMLEVFNTICYTTIYRQNCALYLAKLSDLAVIVGDKSSSNTNKLLETAKKHCSQAFLIEDASELPPLNQHKKICIIAGASTPKELIQEVLTHMTAKDKKETIDVTEVSANNSIFTAAVAKMPKNYGYKKDKQLSCKVISIQDEGVYVNLSNTKGDGFIPNEELAENNWAEFKSSLKDGDTLQCVILSTDKIVTLSKKAMDEIAKVDAFVVDIKEGKPFDIVIQKTVKGGLLSKMGSYTVFIPASHIREGFVKDLEKYVGKKLRVVALTDGVDDGKKKIVASQKELIIQEKKAKEDNFWNNIAQNEIREGKVLRFSSFGAFVNIDGFDCLAHLSDLSWTSVKDPADVLEIGKSYDFVVLKLDRDSKRVSLGYKQLQPHPWVVAAEKFPVGATVKGKVARILDYGAFIELDKGIDGLLHISNVSWEWLSNINEVLKVGDEIDVKIIEFDFENKRITLSRKDTMEKPVELAKPKKDRKSEELEEQA